MMLYDWLFGPFVHHSRRNTATDDPCSAVVAVHADLPSYCPFGSAIDSNAFGVSSWCFLCHLFNRYRFHFADIAQPLHRVRHGRCRAQFELLSM